MTKKSTHGGKVSLCVLAAASVLTAFCAAAAAQSGDIAGEYYATDIRTYLNGREIEAINIDGQTLICAEAMPDYGFSVIWSSEERYLWITHITDFELGETPTVEHSDEASGTPLGNYYETDIVTSLDGEPITAYNTGGRTYILAEETANFGYDVDWDEDNRTLSVTSPDVAGNEYRIPISSFSAYTAQEDSGSGRFCLEWSDGKSRGNGEANLAGMVFSRVGNTYTILMQYYQNEGLFASNISDVLIPLASSGRVGESDPAEKYDAVNEHIRITVNGYSPQKIAVLYGGGNGHSDYELTFDDIPLFCRDEIEKITFSVDGNETDEWYDIPLD